MVAKYLMNYCPYCWPNKRKYHFDLHLEYYIERISSLVDKPLGLLRLRGGPASNLLWKWTLNILSFFRIVTYTTQPDESQLFNRSLIFFTEARNRGLTVEVMRFLGKQKNDFRFTYQGRRYYYEGIPLLLNHTHSWIDNKYKVKMLLAKHDIPVATGKLFTNAHQAMAFIRTLGYPAVVKPNTGSLSHHSTYPITTEHELARAIAIAKQYRPDFIVEQFLRGKLFRATVVARKYVFVCQKEPANIVGDGKSSIAELIALKNADPRRGNADKRSYSLHTIPVDEIVVATLVAQGITLASIVPIHKKIYVHRKITLSCGCDVISRTSQMHPENKKLFLQVAHILQTDLVGIDFIASDIKKSLRHQTAGIIDTNSLPYIDMHQYPSHGKGDPVARLVWDLVLEKLGNSKKSSTQLG